MGEITNKAVNGVKWTTVATVVVTLVQVLRLSVLTRLLEKSDFGLIAIASMVIGFTDIFSELGLTVAIIHKQDITDKQYSSIYWTNILFSIIVFCITCGLSPFIANFYNEAILSTIIPLLGIQILMNGFGKMFQTIKSKNLEYGFISKVRIVASGIGFVITFIFALFDFGIYSLVIGQLSQVAIMQGTYAFEGRRGQKILWHLNFSEISDFIRIGIYRLGSQVLDFFSSKIDVFLIGKFFGMDDLGIYNLAKELIQKPYSIVNQLTNSVATSAFAKVQKDLAVVTSAFIKVITIVGTIAIPIYVAIFISSDIIVEILYGSSYSEVALLLRILSFVGIECAISSQGAILQVSLGRTDLGFKWTIVRIICSIGIILLVSKINITAVAYGQLFLSCALLYLFWLISIKPLIFISFSEYLKPFFRPFLASAIVALPLYLFYNLLGLNVWWQVLELVLFFSLFALYYFHYQREFVSQILGFILPKHRKI